MKRILPICLLALCSCSTMTPEKVNDLAILAGTAASIGATIYLQAHPEQKPAFDLATIALQSFLASGKTDPAQFANLMGALPTDALPGPTADLYVSKPNLVVYDKGKELATKVEGKAALPTMRAISSGLTRAMLAKPAPGRSAKRVEVPVVLP